jgi:hypothetical protein
MVGGSIYAEDQPEGFINRVEKVAIVGVRFLNRSPFSLQKIKQFLTSCPHRAQEKAGRSIGKHLTQHLIQAAKQAVTVITRLGSTNKPPEGDCHV